MLGAVENMAYLQCPNCGEQVELFPRAEAQSIWSMGIERIARLPFAPIDSQRAPLAELANRVVEKVAES